MAPFLLDLAPARSGSDPLIVVAVVLIVIGQLRWNLHFKWPELICCVKPSR